MENTVIEYVKPIKLRGQRSKLRTVYKFQIHHHPCPRTMTLELQLNFPTVKAKRSTIQRIDVFIFSESGQNHGKQHGNWMNDVVVNKKEKKKMIKVAITQTWNEMFLSSSFHFCLISKCSYIDKRALKRIQFNKILICCLLFMLSLLAFPVFSFANMFHFFLNFECIITVLSADESRGLILFRISLRAKRLLKRV